MCYVHSTCFSEEEPEAFDPQPVPSKQGSQAQDQVRVRVRVRVRTCELMQWI